MVRWYHLILSAYGFWLPNDPRGSWSEFVRSWELYKFGPATKTNEKRSLARVPHDSKKRVTTKKALKYPAVRFSDLQRNAIADGFAEAISEASYEVLACCIGFDHAHLIVARHQREIEKIAAHLKSKATMALTDAQRHPLREFRSYSGSVPTPWAAGSWNVFINNQAYLLSAIRYVRQHPYKEGLRQQNWAFIKRLESEDFV
jgi:REP element-mobilizing transposase RayT